MDDPQTSYPHLIQVSPAYEQARRKIVFIGQQTCGWAPNPARTAAMEADLPYRLIDDLFQVYDEFFPPAAVSPFWRAAQQVYSALLPNGPADGYVWADLVKVDENQQRPSDAIECDWAKQFNVLPDELAILRPDVLIFFTGPYYDDRLCQTFPGAQLIPLLETDSSIARVEHPALPPHTYRTYHPGYLARGHWQVIDQLIALCQEQGDHAQSAPPKHSSCRTARKKRWRAPFRT